MLRPSWQLSVALAALALAVLAVVRWWLRRRPGRRAELAAAAAREVALVMALLALWQYVGGFVRTRSGGAFERGAAIDAWEHRVHLSGERTLQHALLPHPWLVEAMNGYYAFAHLNGMAVFLVWVWWRHRDAYAGVRRTVVAATLVCLLVQFVPVAPPRLMPGAGFADTALLYHQSVYGDYASGLSSQLSAMPSVHVCWACIVAWYAARLAPRRWRPLGVVHLACTLLVVAGTANHWWLDGIVAGGIVALVICLQAVGERAPTDRSTQVEALVITESDAHSTV